MNRNYFYYFRFKALFFAINVRSFKKRLFVMAKDSPHISDYLRTPEYYDYIYIPRTYNGKLPSARVIAFNLLTHNPTVSSMFVYFGQFIAHDMTQLVDSGATCDSETNNLSKNRSLHTFCSKLSVKIVRSVGWIILRILRIWARIWIMKRLKG